MMESLGDFLKSWDRSIERLVLADYFNRLAAAKEQEISRLLTELKH